MNKRMPQKTTIPTKWIPKLLINNNNLLSDFLEPIDINTSIIAANTIININTIK